jgi:hypothetical protein
MKNIPILPTAEELAFEKYPRSLSEKDSELRNTFLEGLELGAKWQAERMYSEEDMINFHKWAYQKNRIEESDKTTKELLKEWFEPYKKK